MSRGRSDPLVRLVKSVLQDQKANQERPAMWGPWGRQERLDRLGQRVHLD